MRRPLGLLLLGVAGLVVTAIVAAAAADLYTELLWFRHAGYAEVFRTRLLTAAGVRIIAALIGGGFVFANLWLVVRQLGPVHLRRTYGNLEIAEQVPQRLVTAGVAALAVLTGMWLSGITYTPAATLSVLTWLRHEAWGLAEPLFGRDVGFYIYTLPMLQRVLGYLLALTLWSAVLVVAAYALSGGLQVRERRLQLDARAATHLAGLAAATVAIIAVRYWLGRYDFVLQGTGFGGIVGYTDVHARLPARSLLAVLGLTFAAAIGIGARRESLLIPAAAGAAVVVAAIAAVGVYPAIVQSLRVVPNQLAREQSYIHWNMEFTRRGYDLDRIRREPLAIEPRADWSAAQQELERLPLWDAEPLRTVFEQNYAGRDYYFFPSVTFDRYGPPGDAWQVAIGVREFRPERLPPTAQTWQTLHLNTDVVRGFGAVVTQAAGTRADPDLWVGEINPVQRDPAAPPQLELTEPSVYFGETLSGYIVLGAATTAPPPPDLPAAAPSSPRTGDTAIPLTSFARVFAFALRFGDYNLLFASELTRQSRLVFRRGIGERLAQLAPFLLWDSNAQPVIHEGRIVWLVDGYTATAAFPLAAAYSLENVGRLRYVRNAVKATVDAVTGDVAIYALEPDDPILRTYARIFPTLFRPASAISPSLRRHWRYPPALLRMQAEMLKSYHLERAEPFFAGEDVWELPDERSAQGAAAPYRPVFMLLRVPGEPMHEFVALIPFTLRERPVMSALLLARSDPPHYGELVLLELPRDQQVRGPALISSLVLQDPVIASQVALWRQTGEVQFGQLRVVPLERSILYVQPLYLSAHGSPNPQLHGIIVSDGARVHMAPPPLSVALAALGGDAEAAAVAVTTRTTAASQGGQWAQEALDLLEEAERRLRAGDWAGFGARWTELQRMLRRASQGGSRP